MSLLRGRYGGGSGGGALGTDVGTTELADDAVTNAKLANMTTKTYKGRTSGTTGDPEDVAAATVAADLSTQASMVALGTPMPWTQDPGTLSNTALGLGSSNRAIFQRVKGAGAISKIRMNIVASSGNISVAVYAGSGSGATAVPGTRLATSGSVASPGTGLREISLGATVNVDASCWIGISADNTSVTFSKANRANTTALEAGLAGFQATAHPCPLNPSITQADGSIDTGIVLIGVP